MWCYLGPFLICFLSCGLLTLVAWVVPLLIRNGQGQTSRYVRFHAGQSLNFFIEMLLAGFVAGVLTIVLIGLVLLPVIVVWELVFSIVATIQASGGKWYRIPLNLQLID